MYAFADDIVLCSTRGEHVQRKIEEWRRALEERGLKIGRKKTKYLGCNEHQYAEIHLHGDKLKKVKTFTHLGLTLAEDGELDAEVTHIVKSLWNNWNTMCGVLGDREHEREDQGEGVQGSGKTDTGVWGRDIGIGEGTGK